MASPQMKPANRALFGAQSGKVHGNHFSAPTLYPRLRARGLPLFKTDRAHLLSPHDQKNRNSREFRANLCLL